jgi:phosphohistidine phosphatase
VETAELLAPVLDGKAICSPALARAPNQDVLDALDGRRVALVGHEPWMGGVVAWLTTGALPHGSVFAFKRGGVAWLEGQPQPGQMVLQAFLPPKVLRELGQGVSR